MNPERPSFNIENREPEQEVITPDFLQEQTRLPKDLWDRRFQQLIEEKSKENQQEQVEEVEESPEVLREKTFERYLNGLGLNEEFLRGKKVLDLGSGEGEFVKSLIEKDITSEAYGIDAQADESLAKDEFKDHFFQGNFEEDYPVQDVDYIVSVGAVSNGVWGGKEVMNIGRIIEKSFASLKEGGEIRIYPIQEAAEATPLEGIQASRQKWDELLAEISDTQKIKYEVNPRNIKVSGKNNDIILESVLVIGRE